MAEQEWFRIVQWTKRREGEKAKSIRAVRASGDYSDDYPFTVPPDVAIVSVNDEEDDFGEEEE